MIAVNDNPYSAYTEHAEFLEAAYDDLPQVFPPYAAGLLAAAGRLLATLAYRDALAHGDRPLRRRTEHARHTVLALLPADCDRQDQRFRLDTAACFDALAADIDAGRAPVPRCTAERVALELMLDLAPRLQAASDAELRALGVPVPEDYDQHDYDAPAWEPLWGAFVTDGAEHTIPEALPAGEDGELPEPPPGGWTDARYWFSPFSITTPREPRPRPAWVAAALETGAAPERSAEFSGAARLLGLDDPADPWGAYTDEYLSADAYGPLGQYLTRQGAQLLAAAAEDLAEQGRWELTGLGDLPYERGGEDDWLPGETFFGQLPPLCDRQNAAWRMAMVRAVLDLRDDLLAGRAPLPRCTGEEVALHLIMHHAEHLLDLLDDEELAAARGLPSRAAYTARHRQFSTMREIFQQDEDFVFLFDQDLAEAAGDPDQLAMQWWWTFGNLQSRDAARGFDPALLRELTRASPFSRPDTQAPAAGENAGDAVDERLLPAGLAEEFEHFAGLAQRRFFDVSCAIEQARSLERLLAAALDSPELVVGRVWQHHRAVCGQDMLLVDADFCIDGRQSLWRLRSDMADHEARAWTRALMRDCAAKVIAQYAVAAPELLLSLTRTAPPEVDPTLPATLAARTHALERATTLAGFLRHRRAETGLSASDVAAGALLPLAIVASWEDGAPAAPSQLIRCAPVLQLPEDLLLDAGQGRRSKDYWPLPSPPRAALGRH
uniref:hypothetical protein n=1 Tax=Amycolatopsis sp. CA-096443 TaxID=3239919 RepID=UPI003F490736